MKKTSAQRRLESGVIAAKHLEALVEAVILRQNLNQEGRGLSLGHRWRAPLDELVEFFKNGGLAKGQLVTRPLKPVKARRAKR